MKDKLREILQTVYSVAYIDGQLSKTEPQGKNMADIRPKALDQILTLFRDSLPKEKEEDWDNYPIWQGYNACLKEIKEKL